MPRLEVTLRLFVGFAFYITARLQMYACLVDFEAQMCSALWAAAHVEYPAKRPISQRGRIVDCRSGVAKQESVGRSE